MTNTFLRHPDESRDPDTRSASASRKYRWIPAFAGMPLLLLALTQNVYADDLSSTKRSPGSVPVGTIGSTIRSSGPSKPDPMLNTAAPDPADALSTSNPMTDQDPMLSTSGGVPSSAISTTTKSKHQDPMLSTSAGVPRSAISTAIDPRACNMLTKHTPSADVAVQPGMDANGNAVAPADAAGAPQMKLPNKFDIPLTVNLAQQLHLDTSKPPFNTLGAGTEAWLGTLSVEGDKAYFNGQPLSDQQQDNLAVLCMKAQ